MLSMLRPPGRQLLSCRGFTQDARGIDVVSDADTGLDALLASIKYVGPMALLDKAVQFILIELSGDPSRGEMLKIADLARDADISSKLRVVCPFSGPSTLRLMANLEECGIRAMLGRVGAQIRLGDLVRHASNGIVIDGDLIKVSAGDPYAASVLEAIVGLARNLEVRTFACRVSGMASLAMLQNVGVEYVSIVANKESQPSILAETVCN